jgi:PTS system mannose-specific IIA component
MISILLVSHGNLAAAMLESAEMIVGKQPEVYVFGFQQAEAPEALSERLKGALNTLRPQDVLLLSDIRSGTPFNVAGSLMQTYDFRHISGVNLAMLIEALTQRYELGMDELCAEFIETSALTILDVSRLMEEEEA